MFPKPVDFDFDEVIHRFKVSLCNVEQVRSFGPYCMSCERDPAVVTTVGDVLRLYRNVEYTEVICERPRYAGSP
jgi:hypothetical protein